MEGCTEEPNWKVPGPDRLCAYWLKAFPDVSNLLRVWELIDGERAITDWLVRGRTVMLPKEGCEGKPHRYRPIPCLNTSYKVMTGVLAGSLTAHVKARNLLPPEGVLRR